MVWLTWLWGNVRWEGCGVPWDRTIQECPICNELHGTTVHACLVHYGRWAPAFRNGWIASWGSSSTYAQLWWDKAPSHERMHTAKLRIPESFVTSIPLRDRRCLRERVAHHQYDMML